MGCTPKSSTLMGFSLINQPFGGTPIYGNPHLSTSFSYVRFLNLIPQLGSTLADKHLWVKKMELLSTNSHGPARWRSGSHGPQPFLWWRKWWLLQQKKGVKHVTVSYFFRFAVLKKKRQGDKPINEPQYCEYDRHIGKPIYFLKPPSLLEEGYPHVQSRRVATFLVHEAWKINRGNSGNRVDIAGLAHTKQQFSVKAHALGQGSVARWQSQWLEMPPPKTWWYDKNQMAVPKKLGMLRY